MQAPVRPIHDLTYAPPAATTLRALWSGLRRPGRGSPSRQSVPECTRGFDDKEFPPFRLDARPVLAAQTAMTECLLRPQPGCAIWSNAKAGDEDELPRRSGREVFTAPGCEEPLVRCSRVLGDIRKSVFIELCPSAIPVHRPVSAGTSRRKSAGVDAQHLVGRQKPARAHACRQRAMRGRRQIVMFRGPGIGDGAGG